jgi:hypothetical protein
VEIPETAAGITNATTFYFSLPSYKQHNSTQPTMLHVEPPKPRRHYCAERCSGTAMKPQAHHMDPLYFVAFLTLLCLLNLMHPLHADCVEGVLIPWNPETPDIHNPQPVITNCRHHLPLPAIHISPK